MPYDHCKACVYETEEASALQSRAQTSVGERLIDQGLAASGPAGGRARASVAAGEGELVEGAQFGGGTGLHDQLDFAEQAIVNRGRCGQE